jgi:putative aldouronate transport system substrate-binding protein
MPDNPRIIGGAMNASDEEVAVMDDDRTLAAGTRAYSRRAVLRAALGLAGAAALAACGAEGATPAGGGANPTAATGGANPAPTTGARPATAAAAVATRPPAKPNLPADAVIPSPAKDVPDAYLKLPPAYKTVSNVPGKGSRVTTLIQSYSPPVPGRNENRYWQEYEKRIGVTYEPNLIPADNYKEKLAAVVAGGDLPDLTTVELLNAPDHYKIVQQGAYADLTPYLSGDALQEFPNLAQIPEYGWQNSAIDKKFYGVPSVRFLPDFNMVWRPDWAEKVGNRRPKNADEFLQLMTDITKKDPDGNGQPDTWGMGAWGTANFNLSLMQHIHRVPNGWRKNPDGTLTNAIETAEFKAAVAFTRRLFEAGVYHPDAASYTIQQAKDGFSGGKFGGYMDGWTAVIGQRSKFRELSGDPSKPVAEMFIPMGHDGGSAVTYNSSGYFGFAAIPAKVARDRERVKELLRICDYNCAPFGSEEFVFTRYGLEGVHHTLQNGAPIQTDQGKAEIGALTGFSRRNDIFYYPSAPEDARFMQNTCKDLLAIGIDNPVLTLYSPTNSSKAGELSTLRTDRLNEIIQGRQPLSAVDTYIQEWKSRGGDQIRKEYEEALKA